MKTEVKERPILFSGPMVRAILDGRKTQTRRLIKAKGIWSVEDDVDFRHDHWPAYEDEAGEWQWMTCPYGQIGDRLWVKETWKTGCNLDQYSPKRIREQFEDAGYRLSDHSDFKCCPMFYAADGEHKRWGDDDIAEFGAWGKTRVSIHMPRWASRITLEVTGVRVERLNEISEGDAQAEGVERIKLSAGPDFGLANGILMRGHPPTSDYVTAFRSLWESINGPGSWALNPWVWVIEFERVANVKKIKG